MERLDPASEVLIDQAEAVRVFRRLVCANSFIGFEFPSGAIVQMVRQADATWWIETISAADAGGYGTAINEPMAEQALNSIFSGDETLSGFQRAFSFMKWKKVQLGKGRAKPNTSG